MRLTAVLAASDDGVIGVDGRLPWRLPPDMRRFREITTGGLVVMGRRTYDSIGRRPLPLRTNVVLTRTLPTEIPHEHVWHTTRIEDIPAIRESAGYPPMFVIGGAEIYALLWSYVDRVELTEVHTRVLPAGDARVASFTFQRSLFREIQREAGEHEGLRYDFATLERRTNA